MGGLFPEREVLVTAQNIVEFDFCTTISKNQNASKFSDVLSVCRITEEQIITMTTSEICKIHLHDQQ
jgi:hypothetical protein